MGETETPRGRERDPGTPDQAGGPERPVPPVGEPLELEPVPDLEYLVGVLRVRPGQVFEPFQVTAGSVPDALEKVRTFHGSVYPEPSGHVFTVYAPWGTGQNHPWSVMLVEATSKADPFSIQAVYRVSAVDAFALPPPGSPKYVEPTGPPRIWQRDDVTHKPMAARVPIKPDAESHPGPAPGLSDLMRVESSKPGPPK